MADFGVKIKLSVDQAKSYSEVLKGARAVGDRLSSRSTPLGKIKIDIDKSYIEKQYRSVLSSLTKGDFAKLNGLSLIDDKTLNKIKSETEQYKRVIAELREAMNSANTTGKTGGIANNANEFKKEADAARTATKEVEKYQAALNNRINAVQKSINSSTTGLKSINSQENIDALLNKYNALQSEIERIRTLKGEEAAEAIAHIEEETQAYLQQIATIKSAEAAEVAKNKTATAANQETIRSSNQLAAAYNKQVNLVRTIQNYLRANSRIQGTEYSTKINSILDDLRSGRQFNSREIQAYATQFKSITTDINAAGLAGKSFGNIISDGIKKFSSWFGISQLVMQGVRGIKEMINTVTALDTAMTELRKVTDLTEQQYAQFANTASTVAKQVGATITDTINASADFARLGYNIDEATQLANAALVYKNVGDGIEEIGEASESIISTIKAFGIEAEDAMGIVDRFNEVGKVYAQQCGNTLKESSYIG